MSKSRQPTVRSVKSPEAIAALRTWLATFDEVTRDRGQDYFEECYRRRVVASLRRRAQQLGMKLVPETQTA